MLKTHLKIVIILTLFLSCKEKTANKVSRKRNYIDNIKTEKQINDLISRIENNCYEIHVNDTLKYRNKYWQHLSDSLKVKPWAKADFDKNGLTDILVTSPSSYNYPIICILDKGNGYQIKRITRYVFQYCTLPVVSNDKIKYYFESKEDPDKWFEPSYLKQITLTYQFGDFIEENLNPANHKIEKIQYLTTGCYGSCPIFKLTINSDKSATWEAKRYNNIDNNEVTGNLITKVSDDKFNEIIDLLNYINFETLKDKYAVNWTDDQASILEITYDNGKVKKIYDYGLIGTFGLDRVYQLLFELRENQKWTK